MIDIGWFSTGRGEGSLGLLQTVQDAILRGELDARIQFIFSNREPGEAEGSDRFLQKAHYYDIPLVTFSSQGFRRSKGGGPFSEHRLDYDREVMSRLESYNPDICVLAGYMLITDVELCNHYTMLNFHPAPPNGPVGTWQDVIWSLIEDGAQEAGGYIHLATEDLDRGPVLTYYTFPVRGEPFDTHWKQFESLTTDILSTVHDVSFPPFSSSGATSDSYRQWVNALTAQIINTGQGKSFPFFPTSAATSDSYRQWVDALTAQIINIGQGESFPVFPTSGSDRQWVDALTAQIIKIGHGENLPLFQLIRQEGVKRERPLLLETLKAFAGGDIRVEGRQVLDGSGQPTGGLGLKKAIERTMQSDT